MSREALARLADGAAVITGASSGLGAALAAELAAAGLDLVLVGRDRDGLERQAAALTTSAGTRVSCCIRDLADGAALAGLADEVAALAAKPLSVVIHCAAHDDGHGLAASKAVTVSAGLGVNLVAPWLIAGYALADMARLGHGQIVLVSSNMALAALPGGAGYGIAKAALERLAAGLLAERPDRGIDVLVVVPGLIASPLLEAGRARQPAALTRWLPKPQAPDALARAIVARGFGRSGTLVLDRRHRLFRCVARLAPHGLQSLLSVVLRNRRDAP